MHSDTRVTSQVDGGRQSRCKSILVDQSGVPVLPRRKSLWSELQRYIRSDRRSLSGTFLAAQHNSQRSPSLNFCRPRTSIIEKLRVSSLPTSFVVIVRRRHQSPPTQDTSSCCSAKAPSHPSLRAALAPAPTHLSFSLLLGSILFQHVSSKTTLK